MQTIGAILGNQDGNLAVEAPELPSTAKFGIELELEGATKFPNVAGWQAIADGSLRNGIEYVFDGPQGGVQAMKTIAAMQASLKKYPPAPTFRCSTHIHLDVRDMTIAGLKRLVIAYCSFEDVMFDHCDPYRRYSNFCIPYFINDRYLNKVQSTIFNNAYTPGQVLRALREFPKYSSLNLQPVQHFGSVEFRGSHAITSGDDMLALAQRMLFLKKVAVESTDKTDLEFLNRLNKLKPSEVFLSGLKPLYVRDIGCADSCYSNALMLLTEMPQGHVLGGIPVDWEQGAAPVAAPQVNADRWTIAWNTATFDNYGILIPHTNTVMDAIKIIRAFETIRGVRAPKLNQLIRNQPRDYSDYELGLIRISLTNSGLNPDNHGF
jgi:hypothetical protein